MKNLMGPACCCDTYSDCSACIAIGCYVAIPVSVTGPGGFTSSGTTDVDGKYCFTPTVTGTYSYVGAPSGHPSFSGTIDVICPGVNAAVQDFDGELQLCFGFFGAFHWHADVYDDDGNVIATFDNIGVVGGPCALLSIFEPDGTTLTIIVTRNATVLSPRSYVFTCGSSVTFTFGPSST